LAPYEEIFEKKALDYSLAWSLITRKKGRFHLTLNRFKVDSKNG